MPEAAAVGDPSSASFRRASLAACLRYHPFLCEVVVSSGRNTRPASLLQISGCVMMRIYIFSFFAALRTDCCLPPSVVLPERSLLGHYCFLCSSLSSLPLHNIGFGTTTPVFVIWAAGAGAAFSTNYCVFSTFVIRNNVH